jgi:hypothetical protein
MRLAIGSHAEPCAEPGRPCFSSQRSTSSVGPVSNWSSSTRHSRKPTAKTGAARTTSGSCLSTSAQVRWSWCLQGSTLSAARANSASNRPARAASSTQPSFPQHNPLQERRRPRTAGWRFVAQLAAVGHLRAILCSERACQRPMSRSGVSCPRPRGNQRDPVPGGHPGRLSRASRHERRAMGPLDPSPQPPTLTLWAGRRSPGWTRDRSCCRTRPCRNSTGGREGLATARRTGCDLGSAHRLPLVDRHRPGVAGDRGHNAPPDR